MGENKEQDQLSIIWKAEVDVSWDKLLKEKNVDNGSLFALLKKEGEILRKYPLKQVASMFGESPRLETVSTEILEQEKLGLILDVGAGPIPEIAFKCCTKENFVIALEISPIKSRIANAVAKIRGKKEHLQMVTSDANQLPFRADIFNIVICCDVLEHLLKPWKALKEISRVSQRPPKGKIYLTIPNKGRLDVLFRKFSDRLLRIEKEERAYFMDKSHLTEYTFLTFRHLLRMANLRVVRRFYVSYQRLQRRIPNVLWNLLGLFSTHMLGLFSSHIMVQCERTCHCLSPSLKYRDHLEVKGF